MSGDIFFLVITSEEVQERLLLLVQNVKKLGVFLNILQCSAQPAQQGIFWPKLSIVLRLSTLYILMGWILYQLQKPLSATRMQTFPYGCFPTSVCPLKQSQIFTGSFFPRMHFRTGYTNMQGLMECENAESLVQSHYEFQGSNSRVLNQAQNPM